MQEKLEVTIDKTLFEKNKKQAELLDKNALVVLCAALISVHQQWNWDEIYKELSTIIQGDQNE